MARKLLSAGLDWIQFSFDGITKHFYERQRIGANFEQTLINIMSFQLLNIASFYKRCEVRVASTLAESYNIESVLTTRFWDGKIPLVPVTKHDWGGRIDSPQQTNKPCRHLWKQIAFSSTGKVGYCCVDGNFSASLPTIYDKDIQYI